MNSGAEEEAVADKDVCGNCGIAGVDEIKLEECDGCDLVKYCSDKCREEHREQHHEECKRRAGELHDKRLFTQPDRNHIGECPFCFLPHSLDGRKSAFMTKRRQRNNNDEDSICTPHRYHCPPLFFIIIIIYFDRRLCIHLSSSSINNYVKTKQQLLK